jgi:hypothetical protein
MAVAVDVAPKVANWVERMDDLAWLPIEDDDGWASLDALDSGTHDLLHEIGRTYAPFMAGNAQALMSGDDEMTCDIEGREYRQAPFGYQGKCLQWLREGHAALDNSDRQRVDAVLADTGCEVLFT